MRRRRLTTEVSVLHQIAVEELGVGVRGVRLVIWSSDKLGFH